MSSLQSFEAEGVSTKNTKNLPRSWQSLRTHTFWHVADVSMEAVEHRLLRIYKHLQNWSGKGESDCSNEAQPSRWSQILLTQCDFRPVL